MTERLTTDDMERKCRDVRIAMLDESEVAGAGHYASSLSIVEILVGLYYSGFLNVRPPEPDWQERDRFFLSKGHGCSALYPILADLGFFDSEHLSTFANLGSILGDHPDVKKIPGIDFSSGSLGHGLSVGCGMSSALRHQGHASRVVVLMGDGEMNEGQVWEAAAYASYQELANLLVIIDRNRIQVDGPTEEILDFEPVVEKWESFGWRVNTVDGHSLEQLTAAYDAVADRTAFGAPSLIVAETTGGRGIGLIENQAAWHLGYLGGADRAAALEELQAGLSTQGVSA